MRTTVLRRVALAVAVTAVGSAGLTASRASALSASATSGRLTPAQIDHVLRPAPNVESMPTPALARRIQASMPRAVGNLTYHNGPVMQQANNAVLLFWNPGTLQDGSTSSSFASNYERVIKQYFGDIGGSTLNEILTQYYQTVNGPTEFVQNVSNTVKAVDITTAYPAAGPGCNGNGVDCIDDQQLRSFIQDQVANTTGLPEDLNTEYYVFLAPHESSCFNPTFCFKADNAADGSNFQFCAYHTYFTDANTANNVVYANMPYASLGFNTNCSTLSQFPNGVAADAALSASSHEMSESTTDPYINGWYYQSVSGEIGDECAYDYGSLNFDGGIANEEINGHYYAVQQEWSNAVSGCVQGVYPSAPANDDFSAAHALRGSPDLTGQLQASTISATKEAGEPNPAGTAGAHSVWYSITPAASGQLRVETCQSTFDTVLGVYTGSAVGSLTKKADNDNSCGTASAVVIPVTAGTKYWIEVDGRNGDWGQLTLSWWIAHNAKIVSTSWSTSEAARLQAMGASLDTSDEGTPKASTYIISYILGFASTTPTPVSPPAHGHDVTFTDFWMPSEIGVLNRVTNKFVLSKSDAVTYCTKVVDFLLSLGGH